MGTMNELTGGYNVGFRLGLGDPNPNRNPNPNPMQHIMQLVDIPLGNLTQVPSLLW